MVWWEWLIAAAVLGIVEVLTVTFVLLWIAIGALITAFLTPFVPTPWMQLLIFAVISVISLIATRPLVRRWRSPRGLPLQRDHMVGQRGVVVTAVEPGAYATVRVKGDLWSARCDQPLKEGQEVAVVAVSSAVLTVVPVKEAFDQ
ncbi:hypothetical protein GCM10025857_16450 [Alicyclobacillus contaminans]|uniref:NfeD family protein n=1 Tax=Alicyclobacillus contaminans TaxID=392016 RepID=UPI0003FF1791|nr:NfeD family protein [Alicyclobacillus contaminans]GMA50288.1 hypothetical protein GCM10025857_16450 [Alicyclobacillus contaminans]